LKRVHLYERVKASFLYDIVWRFADKRVIEAKVRETEFYENLLNGFRKGDLVFDIGANRGAKTEAFLHLGARVVAVDPDQANGAALAEKFLRHRFIPKPVIVVGKAVSDSDGSATFWIDEPGSGKNTLNQKWVEILRDDRNRFGHKLSFKQTSQVESITLDTLISIYGLPFFIKIDVEGHECKVLEGLQQPVRYLSFEVNLPEFRSEGLQCLKRLDRLDPLGQFNYSIDSATSLAGEWADVRTLQVVLNESGARSIEVFWKTKN
jgi:FkbM family methyltransferase